MAKALEQVTGPESSIDRALIEHQDLSFTLSIEICFHPSISFVPGGLE